MQPNILQIDLVDSDRCRYRSTSVESLPNIANVRSFVRFRLSMQLKLHNLLVTYYPKKTQTLRLQVNVSRQNEDLEKGKPRRDSDDTKTYSVTVLLKRLAIMIILSALIAGGAALWYYFGWQCFLGYLFPAILVFLIVVNYDWCYVAVVTAPRDIR